MSAPRSRVGLLGLLFAAALAISAFTLRRGGAEFDEGLVLQAAARVASGQAPYADFAWPYGPAHPYLLGWSFDLLGPSLIGWRVLRSLVDAAVAVTVYALARRQGAPPPLALAGWLVAACAMAQPTSATPFAPALLLALLAVLATTGADRATAPAAADAGPAGNAPAADSARAAPRRVLLPAVLTALAAAWRLDFGLYAGAAVVVALALSTGTGRARLRAVGLYAALAAGLGLLAYLPFLIAVGPADLYDDLVGASLRERDWWTIPFPLSYDGAPRGWPPGDLAEDAKDLLGFYTPLLACAGLALLALLIALHTRAERRAPATTTALATLGLGCLAYLLSRSDELHATPLIVVLAASLPAALAWAFASGRAVDRDDAGRPATTSRLRGPGALPAVLAAAVLALLAVYGVANRGSALLRPPPLATIDLPVADGAQAPPAEARALARMARIVDDAVPPGEPIYTITRRSDLVRFNQPLVYVLADRPNPTARDYAIQTPAAKQRALVAELARARPRAIVRWTAPASTEREPNLRGQPTGVRVLDRWVADRYRLLARAGDYEILVPRGGS